MPEPALLRAASCGLFIGLLAVACSSGDSSEPAASQGGSAGAALGGQAGIPSGTGGASAGQAGTSAGGNAGTVQDASAAGAAGSVADSGIIPNLGPTMVDIQGGMSIDSTEVTRDQYAQWLATNPDPTKGQPDACKWKTSFTPTCEWPAGAKGAHPVVCVDWCDARAFCAAGGKRLCGKIGGGPSGWNDFKTAGVDQWFHACSAGGKVAYPYGDTYGAQTCNGAEAGNKGTWPAGSAAGCQSAAAGFQNVLDLSGNVLEWQDNCQANVGQGDTCRARGGSYNDGPSGLVCSDAAGKFRDDKLAVLGFRCCSL